TPRGPHERYHTSIQRLRDGYTTWPAACSISPSMLYPQDVPVGRMLDQPRRRKEDGRIISSDSATFEKWSQSLAGVFDEIRILAAEPLQSSTLFAVVPAL